MDLLKYVVLDDTTHVIGPGEYTVCGLVIPQGGTWSTDAPKKLCGECAKRTKDTDEFGVNRTEQAAPVAEAPVTTKEAKSGSKA